MYISMINSCLRAICRNCSCAKLLDCHSKCGCCECNATLADDVKFTKKVQIRRPPAMDMKDMLHAIQLGRDQHVPSSPKSAPPDTKTIVNKLGEEVSDAVTRTSSKLSDVIDMCEDELKVSDVIDMLEDELKALRRDIRLQDDSEEGEQPGQAS